MQYRLFCVFLNLKGVFWKLHFWYNIPEVNIPGGKIMGVLGNEGYRFLPYLLIEDGIVTEVGYPFQDLAGYSQKEICNKSLSCLLNEILRVNIPFENLANASGEIAVFFTKSGEPRIAKILFEEEDNKSLLVFHEIPRSRLQDISPEIPDYCSNFSKIPTAVFGGVSYALLFANKAFFEWVNKITPFQGCISGQKINGIFKRLGNENPAVFLNNFMKSAVDIVVNNVILEGTCESLPANIHLKGIKTDFGMVIVIMRIFEKEQCNEEVPVTRAKSEYLAELIDIPLIRLSYPEFDIEYINKPAKNLFIQEDNLNFSTGSWKLIRKIVANYDYESKKAILQCIRNVIDKEGPVRKITSAFTDRDKNTRIFYFIFTVDEISKKGSIFIAVKDISNIYRDDVSNDKDDFLSLIAHELKTPINMVISTIQVMERVCVEQINDRVRYYLEKIKRNTNKQMKLVRNLLDLSRAESGYLTVKKRNLDIVKLTKTILESVRLYAGRLGLNLRFNSLLVQKIIAVDEEKYERIILNLISNAIKYSRTGVVIHVNISKVRDMVCIEVKDEGIGIPEDKIGLIFNRFERVTDVGKEGAGIGLALVKKFVTMLNGSIEVKSKLGEGSSFKVYLPDEMLNDIQEDEYDKYQAQKYEDIISYEFSDIYWD